LNISGKKTSYRNVRFESSPDKRQQNREEEQKRYTGNQLLAGGPNGIFFRFCEEARRVIVLKGHLLRGIMLMYIRHDKKSTAEYNAYDQNYNFSFVVISRQNNT